MAVTAKQYAKFPLSVMKKLADLSGDNIKVALFTGTLVPSQANDQFFDAAPYNANQVANGNGYATGGALLASKTVATAALVTTFDAADPSWTVTGAGFTWRIAVFYDDTPASNKPVISYMDMGADQVWTTPGTYGITLDANGIARITVS